MERYRTWQRRYGVNMLAAGKGCRVRCYDEWYKTWSDAAFPDLVTQLSWQLREEMKGPQHGLQIDLLASQKPTHLEYLYLYCEKEQESADCIKSEEICIDLKWASFATRTNARHLVNRGYKQFS